MPAKSKSKKRPTKSKHKQTLDPDTTLSGLEEILAQEIGNPESGVHIEYVGGKKTGKNTKLKNIWEGFEEANWPKKLKK